MNLPKRQKAIVEHFIKKVLNEDSGQYYRGFLDKIKLDGNSPSMVKFIDPENNKSTVNLNLNQVSAKVIIQWLKQNMSKLPAGN